MEALPAVNEVLKFIDITPKTGLELVGLGFMGGILSGFLGSGGAFVMTPGMMALGVPGIAAVSANLAHKFGKALVGSKKHSKLGNVDVKLGILMVIFLLLETQLAVTISEKIFASMGKAGSNLYISIVFVILLSALSVFMYLDISKSKKGIAATSSGNGILAKIGSLNIPPMVHFKVANTRASLWLTSLVGIATGWLAGTVGVGGFIGVPAMIYLLRIPTTVAAGTEMFLAIFSGAYGAFSYALHGFVDIRLTLLLYLGSLLGLNIGANATKMVKDYQIKLVLLVTIFTSALSRLVAIPKYLSDMHKITLSSGIANFCDILAAVLLYGGAIMGGLMIIKYVIEYMQQQKRPVTNQVQSYH